MGTRNLIVVIHGKKPVISKYCQWDGYPDGQGRIILEFLRGKFDRAKLVERLKRVREIDEKEYDSLYEKVLGYVPGDFIKWEDSKKFAEVYPSLNRDMGGTILEFIQEGEIPMRHMDFSGGNITERKIVVKAVDDEILVVNNPDFGKDDTWCEWIWTVNLDSGTFRGQDGPHPTIINEWRLSRLPTLKTFLKRFDRSED